MTTPPTTTTTKTAATPRADMGEAETTPTPGAEGGTETTPRADVGEAEIVSAPRAAVGEAATGIAHPRRWAILALVLAVECMDLIDGTIVNVAAPSIRADLGS